MTACCVCASKFWNCSRSSALACSTAFEYGISANEIKFASARARFLSSSISRNLKLSSGISNASCFPSRMQGACWRHPCSAWRPLGDEGLHATVVSFRYVILR